MYNTGNSTSRRNQQIKIERKFSRAGRQHILKVILINSEKPIKKLFKKYREEIKRWNKYAKKQLKKKKNIATTKGISDYREFEKLISIIIPMTTDENINLLMIKMAEKFSPKIKRKLRYEDALINIGILIALDVLDAERCATTILIKSNLNLLSKEECINYLFLKGEKALPPMLVEPLPVLDVLSSPYLTNELKYSHVLKGDMPKQSRAGATILFQTLNILNRTPLALNTDITELDEGMFLKKKKLKKRKIEFQQGRDIRELLGTKPFYQVWNYDNRYRVYASGYQINFHGSDYKRACIRLAQEEELTVEGLSWLILSCSNKYSGEVSRLSYNDRISWFHDIGATVDWKTADKPFQFLAMRNVIEKGVGYKTGILIGLDGTSSGTQILAASANCRKSMKACNLIMSKEDKVQDPPLTILKEMISHVKGKKKHKLEKLGRKKVKKAYMTKLYGSVATPVKIFGEKLVPILNRAIATKLPGVAKLLGELRKCIDPETANYVWKLRDGVKVVIPVKYKKQYRLHLFPYETRITHYETIHRHNKADLSVIANSVHILDAGVARHIVLGAKKHKDGSFTVLPIHDEMFTHPNHMGKVIDMYSEEFESLRIHQDLKILINNLRHKKSTKGLSKKVSNKNKVNGIYSLT